MKSLKQIADELNIDKQNVYRFVTRNHITASCQVKQSKMYDEVAERLIKSHFNHITTSHRSHQEAHQKSESDAVGKSQNDRLLEQLIKELEEKNKQLAEKDLQIREKDQQIKSILQSLDQAQKLHARAEQDLLELKAESAVAEPDPEQQTAAGTGWWQRIKGLF